MGLKSLRGTPPAPSAVLLPACGPTGGAIPSFPSPPGGTGAKIRMEQGNDWLFRTPPPIPTFPHKGGRGINPAHCFSVLNLSPMPPVEERVWVRGKSLKRVRAMRSGQAGGSQEEMILTMAWTQPLGPVTMQLIDRAVCPEERCAAHRTLSVRCLLGSAGCHLRLERPHTGVPKTDVSAH